LRGCATPYRLRRAELDHGVAVGVSSARKEKTLGSDPSAGLIDIVNSIRDDAFFSFASTFRTIERAVSSASTNERERIIATRAIETSCSSSFRFLLAI
jgi:hypothetical protein